MCNCKLPRSAKSGEKLLVFYVAPLCYRWSGAVASYVCDRIWWLNGDSRRESDVDGEKVTVECESKRLIHAYLAKKTISGWVSMNRTKYLRRAIIGTLVSYSVVIFLHHCQCQIMSQSHNQMCYLYIL